MLDLQCCCLSSTFTPRSVLSTPDIAAGAPDLDIIPPDRLRIVLFFFSSVFPLACIGLISFLLFCFFSSRRADCMCSSCLTTTQLAECACSSWSSLSVSPFHGFMVSHTYFPLICLRHPPPLLPTPEKRLYKFLSFVDNFLEVNLTSIIRSGVFTEVLTKRTACTFTQHDYFNSVHRVSCSGCRCEQIL